MQSVALRLICEREAEIEVFRAREYWTVEAVFTTPGGAPFTARLTHLDGKRLDQFDLNNEALAEAAKAAVEAGTFTVGSVERKRVRRNPPPPFTTSTLQQEASRKLGFGAQQTMRMRAAAVRGRRYRRRDDRPDHLYADRRRADGARGDRRDPRPRARRLRRRLPAGRAARIHQPRPRTRRKRTRRSARPTSPARRTASRATSTHDQRRLYELVWKRAVASQMQSAELDQVAVDVDRRQGPDACAPPARSSRSTGS